MKNDIPDITQRIKSIIDGNFNGSVRKFCLAMGMTNSTKVNRLFSKDKRNNEYPIPSTDIILLIANTFDISTDWLLRGSRSNENKSVNNITIDNKKVQGERNIVNSTNTSIDESNNKYIAIIKQQQEQIDRLINLLGNGTTQ